MRIAFGHKQRAGKDESANYLKSKYGGVIVKFADPIYEIEREVFRIAGLGDPEHLPKERRRFLLQTIGTEWGRNQMGQDIWINAMDRKLDSLPPESNIFITDMRFPNEAELALEHGFTLVEIWRPEEARVAAGATNVNHASENALEDYDGFDHVIFNNARLSDLYAALDEVIKCS